MSDYMKELERLIDALIFAHPHEVEKWRERLLAHAAQAEPECTCKASDMPFGRCCKAPAEPVELPEPDTHCYDTDEERDVWSHSPDQMRTYGVAREAAGYARGVAEERERCAAICDRMGNPLNVKYEGGGCRKAAAAIRAAQKGIE